MSEAHVELYRHHRDLQTKYAYFLLGVAASAIAVAVHFTENREAQWSLIIWGLAVLSWALSFYSGCKHLAYSEVVVFSNIEFLRIRSGMHPEVGTDPVVMQAASQGINDAIETNVNRGKAWASAQFGLLVLGGVFFVIWHVVEMFVGRAPA